MYSHDATLLGFHDPDLGEIHYVCPSWNNSSFVLFTQCLTKDRIVTQSSIVFQDRIHYQGDPSALPHTALSYDGQCLALLQHPCMTEGTTSSVTINGERKFSVPLDSVHYFAWLDDKRLACRGFNRTLNGRMDEDGFRYVINGKLVDHDFHFEPIGQICDYPMIDIIEDGRRYLIYDDGSHSEVLSANECPFHIPFPRNVTTHPIPEQVPGRKGRFRVRLQDAMSPVFEGLATCHGLRPFVYSSDGTLVAFVGVQSPAWIEALETRLQTYLDRMTDPISLAKASLPNYLARFSLAMLFHQDFGPGTRALGRFKKTKRYCPVKEMRAWRKTYDFVEQSFFTPSGRLVVTAQDRGKMRVVIDEIEGPRFDAIYNARVLPNGRVCYLALRGHEFARVIVGR